MPEKSDGFEIFFESDEYNVGRPKSRNNDRLNIRSSTVMQYLYDDLDRVPCPRFWIKNK